MLPSVVSSSTSGRDAVSAVWATAVWAASRLMMMVVSNLRILYIIRCRGFGWGLEVVQYFLELPQVVVGGGPGGDEAADGVMVVGLAELGVADLTGKTLGKVVGQYDELLVGGRVDVEGEMVGLEKGAQALGHGDGVAREGEIQWERRRERGERRNER